MNAAVDIYQTQEEHSFPQRFLRYYFVSKGKRDIVKAIEYQYVKDFDGRPLFNLAFGDFDIDMGTLSDENISNNDDTYKVLNTVLSTVPGLFNFFGNAVLFVQGSDSTPEFIDNCQVTCTRKCNDAMCKKSHRRINIYRGFVDKNYDRLGEEYLFIGGEGAENHNYTEPYKKGEKYNAVFVMKKNA